MKIYFAAPLNTPHERAYVRECAEKMRQTGFDVYVGEDAYIDHQPAFEVTADVDGKAIYSDENKAVRLAKSPFAREVFLTNYAQLAEANLLVALLDGSQVNDRVAVGVVERVHQGFEPFRGVQSNLAPYMTTHQGLSRCT